MEDGPDFSNRRRSVFIASGLMDMLLGGALVSLGLGILLAGLLCSQHQIDFAAVES